MQLYNLFINRPQDITLRYSIPEHLGGIKNIDTMRKVDLEKLDYELQEKGTSVKDRIKNKKIWRMGFPEMILDVQKVTYTPYGNQLPMKGMGHVYLDVVPIHPHRADLTFRNDKTLDKIVYPLTINAIPVTKDNEIVLGVRGGDVEAGKVGVIPGGHIDYGFGIEKGVNWALAKEFNEEMGMPLSIHKHKLELIGVMGNDNLPGINIINRVKMSESFDEIVESWKNAKDRFEHASIFKVDYDELQELSDTGELEQKGTKYETTPFFQDCLTRFVDFNLFDLD
jgi:ADP-ribose pyrophosphatase YjhB (NUDIX family)